MDGPFEQRYDAATCSMLSRVFDSAWEQLRGTQSPAAMPENRPDAQSELAKRITEVFEKGERDPEVLEFVALKTFDRTIKPE